MEVGATEAVTETGNSGSSLFGVVDEIVFSSVSLRLCGLASWFPIIEPTVTEQNRDTKAQSI